MILGTTPDNLIVAADYSHGRIYQINLDNKDISAIDLPDVDKPACVALNIPLNIIYWIEIRPGGSKIRKSQLDGSNATEIYNSGTFTPREN